MIRSEDFGRRRQSSRKGYDWIEPRADRFGERILQPQPLQSIRSNGFTRDLDGRRTSVDTAIIARATRNASSSPTMTSLERRVSSDDILLQEEFGSRPSRRSSSKKKKTAIHPPPLMDYVLRSSKPEGYSKKTRAVRRGLEGEIRTSSHRGRRLRLPEPSRTANKSKWEEGIEAINELLNPRCKAYQHMTIAQRRSLEGVKQLLLLGTSPQGSKMQHVPTALILMESGHGGGDPSLHCMDDTSNYSAHSFALDDTCHSVHTTTSAYILEEYAGVRDNSHRMDLNAVMEVEDDILPPPTPEPKPALIHTDTVATASLTSSRESSTETVSSSPGNRMSGLSFPAPRMLSRDRLEKLFLPPEFVDLQPDQQVEVFEILQWDSINKWDFDIFHLEELTQGQPMLFVGWAILGAPYSQEAMARYLQIDYRRRDLPGYHFLDNDLKIQPKKLYNFIKVIEEDYNSKNAYHNATHGADVLQSLHVLIQESGNQEFMRTCTKLQVFSILLSALVHDVVHFGTTNAYHTKLQTELAVMYNDKSVMENWHVAHAFSRMFDLDLTLPCNRDANDVIFSKFQQSNKRSDCNVLCNATEEQFTAVRKMMIDAILHTDMTGHFEMVNSMRGMLMQKQQQPQDENTNNKSNPISPEDYTWRVLVYMLHMADISGQAKRDHLSMRWTERCFDEFFSQGDQESIMGVPVSPNCNRHTVVIPESQIGFIKFVVEPAFSVLGDYIPFVQEEVLPIIHDNMMYYTGCMDGPEQ